MSKPPSNWGPVSLWKDILMKGKLLEPTTGPEDGIERIPFGLDLKGRDRDGGGGGGGGGFSFCPTSMSPLP